MSASKEPQSDLPPEGEKGLGLKITEKLLPILGPAAVGNSPENAKPTTQDEEARDLALETELTRKTGPDGTTYAVESDKD